MTTELISCLIPQTGILQGYKVISINLVKINSHKLKVKPMLQELKEKQIAFNANYILLKIEFALDSKLLIKLLESIELPIVLETSSYDAEELAVILPFIDRIELTYQLTNIAWQEKAAKYLRFCKLANIRKLTLNLYWQESVTPVSSELLRKLITDLDNCEIKLHLPSYSDSTEYLFTLAPKLRILQIK